MSRKKMREASRLASQSIRARRAGRDSDLTLDEWNEILEFFDNSCAYCQGEYQVIEHYIPISRGGGTTSKNCLPACTCCNNLKDAGGKQHVGVYNNQRVIDFLAKRGVVVNIHTHVYKYEKTEWIDIWKVYCECGDWHEVHGKEEDAKLWTDEDNERGLLGKVTVDCV